MVEVTITDKAICAVITVDSEALHAFLRWCSA
jgi:hypothetical protein